MTYVEFKEKFLPEFLQIKSFAGRIKYANERLQRIGSGSGRIVYDIDGEKVLKLAKNPKGIAQNEAETGAGYYANNHHIITMVFDSADDDEWLIAEKAKKVNEARIKQLTGIPNLTALYYYLRNLHDSYKGIKSGFGVNPELKEILTNNEFAQDLDNFITNYALSAGDMQRPSTYGEVIRNGKPTIVLTDYGLSDEVYDTHYTSKKQGYRMYEMYNYTDGNDDILSELPSEDAIDTRQSMWALMPYGVGDGDDVINERFVNFVLNTDKYPTRRILPSTPSLSDGFHDVINNLSEVFEKVSDKKKFYNNLLELQNYLIRGKFFDREPLEKETMNLSEELNVGMNRDFADKVAKSLAVKLNLGEPQYLGGGGYGIAYQINANQVLKLTTDVCEVDAAAKTRRTKPKHLVYTHRIYKVVATEENQSVYALIEDFIPDRPVEKFSRYIKIVSSLGDQTGDDDLYGAGLLRLLVKGKSKLPEFEGKTLNDYPEMAKLILTSNPEANISDADRQAAYEYMMGLYEIKLDLINSGIKSNDYYEPKNLGYKNGILTYFDIGGCLAPEPDLPPESVVTLPEGKENLDEGINREDADKIANKVAEVFKLNQPRYLKSGTFGAAYDIGDNKILKVTTDKSEAVENLNLIGKPLEYIAEPYKVFEVKPKTGETKHYAIILEKLKTDDAYFGKMMHRLKQLFNEVFKVHLLDAIDQIIYGYDVGLDMDKVEEYFEKNPTDGKFFNDITKIVQECNKYGIESTDFMNYENLGYKPNGNVGFFDVGFGNYFAKTNKEPIPIEVDEDGSAKFSTLDAIGRDNFPVYNQTDDGSPLQDNNLPVNIFAEDLEYNHVVGDATQDRFEISEELLEDVASKYAEKLGIQPEFSDFERKYSTQQNIENKEEVITGYHGDDIVNVIKNPKTLQNVEYDARGIIDKDGNLFLETGYSNIHDVIAQVLADENQITYQPFWYKDLPVEFITVQRLDNTNKIFMGESNQPLKPTGKRTSNWVDIPTREQIKPIYQKFLDKAKQKNPQYEFINELIQYFELYEKNIDPEKFFEKKPAPITERELKYMPGVTGVEVKKKCRLGGKGNTSAQCNQGDIKNLKLKSINENVNVDIPAKLSGFNTVKIVDNGQVVGELEIMDRGIHGDNHYIAVDKIFIDKQFRGKGYADDAMKRLFEYADRNNIIITLTPDNMWGASVPKLTAWYKSLGFIMNKGKKKDFQTMQLMYRLPKGIKVRETQTLNEYREQMEKVYGKTGIYDQEDMDEILRITGGDPYTKFIADIYYYLANRYNKEMVKPTRITDRDREILRDTHERLKRYDKNVLPIHDLYAQEHNAHPLDKMNNLRDREVLIERIKALPSIVLRNLRGDLRRERDHYEFQRLFEIINTIKTSMKLIDQTNPEHREKILKKVFSSANDTLEAVAKRLQDTSIPYLSQDDAAENIVDKVRDLGDEAEILYNENNILVVKINTAEAMGYIGCSSQWCFASNPQQYWDSYTGNEGYATIVFNFNEAPSERNAMVVVLESGEVYDMYNDFMEDGEEYLQSIGVEKYIPHGEHEFAESTIFAKNKLMSEAQLMSLQDLPFKAEVEKLGGKIYSVGGAVRDEFLGKESKDLDVLITGIPMDQLEQILGKYGRVDAVGKSFGVLKFRPQGGDEIDIAIPRTEKPTGAGGHQGFDVTSDHALPIEKDLERRDFTINAIAKDAEGNIVDPYGGQKDLQNKTIRIVNPEAFSDDPLRMLRAVQFASRFGFTIEPETMRMIQENAQRIKEIPAERILTEFDKIITKGNPLIGAQLLIETGLFQQIFGKPKKLSDRLADVKTMGEFIYLLTVGVVENPAEFYKNSLKGDIDTFKEIKALELAFTLPDISHDVAERSVAHNMYLLSPQTLQSQIIPMGLQQVSKELLNGKYPKTIGELAVNGNDLMALGLQGKAIGDTLKMMLLRVYGDKVRNNREELLSLVQNNNAVTEGKKPEDKIEYGCLMLFLEVPIWEKIVSVINPEDVYDEPGYGIEKEPHVTILYGFHDEVSAEDTFKLFKENMPIKPIDIGVKGISIFENPKFDVVKFDVNSPELTKLNNVMKSLPHTDTFKEYHPHITIAYVKPGEGKKYVKLFENERKLKGDELVYSWKGHMGKDGEKLILKEYEYEELHHEKEDTWNIDGKEVNIDFFIEKYYIWNQDEYSSASKESVSRFLEDEYPQFIEDERLKKELLWLLTRNELLDESEVKKVLYSAVVLDGRSKQRLIQRFQDQIPEGWEIIAHHMTINLGPINSKFQKFIGMKVELSVNDIAIDNKVLAVGVSGFESLNAKPHITIAVNRQGGGKPKDSNNLMNWQKLKVPLLVTGKVTEIT